MLRKNGGHTWQIWRGKFFFFLGYLKRERGDEIYIPPYHEIWFFVYFFLLSLPLNKTFTSPPSSGVSRRGQKNPPITNQKGGGLKKEKEVFIKTVGVKF